MVVEMITLAAGPDYTLHPGHTYNLPDSVGKALVDGRYAKRVEGVKAARPGKPDPGDQEPEKPATPEAHKVPEAATPAVK